MWGYGSSHDDSTCRIEMRSLLWVLYVKFIFTIEKSNVNTFYDGMYLVMIMHYVVLIFFLIWCIVCTLRLLIT